MQRRLFRLFLLLAFCRPPSCWPVNWRMSQRQLAYMDSPGLRGAMESSLSLARDILEREKARAKTEAEALAAMITAAPRARSPCRSRRAGASYRFEDPEAPGRRLGRGALDPAEHFPARLAEAGARSPARGSGGPAAAAQLHAIPHGGDGDNAIRPSRPWTPSLPLPWTRSPRAAAATASFASFTPT